MDALRSACLEACKQLYEIGQLDDHFIPITQGQIINQCNLINKNSKNEELELKLLFQHKNKQRSFFEKKINNFSFFKELCYTNTYNLYEIEFITDDKYLKEGNKLGLLTELKLDYDCLSNIIFSSKYSTNIKLNLINDFKLTDNQLNEIGKFTCAIFRSTIASLKKREEDVKFELEKCIFKFVFLNNQNEIDFSSMDPIINFNIEQIKEDMFDDNYCNRLVRAIHTNTDYKILKAKTDVFPFDNFELNGENISFNDYFKKKYDKKILDQKRPLVKVEKGK